MNSAFTPSAYDVILWPCGTWVYRHELEWMTHKSDDFQVLGYETCAYVAFHDEFGCNADAYLAEQARYA